MKEFITACPRNCYSTCSFRVIVENNRLVKILPDPGNRATPEGPCLKGLSYLERTGSEKRLTVPLLKNKSGDFQEISYSEALRLISGKLKTIYDLKKQKSVLYYTGSGMSGLTNEIGYNFFKLFGGATTTYGNFCWPAGLEAVRLTMGEVKHNAPWDIENARLIISWGKNPAETNIQETVFIDRARQKGALFIVIDPRRTPTADKADILFTPKPGTDAALALAIAGILVRDNKIDSDFIKAHVGGFEEFAASLNITPEIASSYTGIPAGEIEKLADLIYTHSPVTFIPGYGMQRYTNGGQTVRALLSLAVLTGNIGKRGAGFNYANLQGYVFDSTKEPLSYYPEINPDPDFRRSISMARLGEDLLACKEPGIEFAWFERGNPLTQAPDTTKIIKAFSEIPFKVVVEQFMTDTAMHADLVLPAKNMFEQQDIISSYWSPYVYYRPKILNSPGEIRTETEMFYDLARELSLDFTDNQIPEPGEASLDIWLDNRIKGLTSLDLEKLKEEKQIAPGYEEIAFSNFEFTTPSGKIELVSNDADKLWNTGTLPDFKYPFERKGHEEGKFHFLTPNTKNRIHSQFGNLEAIKINDSEPLLQVNPLDARELAIEEGGMLRMYNSRGEVFVKAHITADIIRGVVAMPNGWWISENGGGNFLSKGRETDMGHGTAFHDNLVNIEACK
ncbi:MAG: molybdopterin-dependent oxidoreductase [Marinilabiliaceae bacterium]|jgi:anaerobic selenocysteine-containing dehydrogenase|nr:molybdopterin-dependent oxidoreductase [Marinilabiliaceae bacterium]